MAQQVTIEGIAVQLLKSGKSAKETLAAVKRVFPKASTTIKCIYFYSSKHKLGLQRGAEVDEAALKAVLAEIAPKAPVVVKATGTNGPDKLDDAIERAVDAVNMKQMVKK